MALDLETQYANLCGPGYTRSRAGEKGRVNSAGWTWGARGGWGRFVREDMWQPGLPTAARSLCRSGVEGYVFQAEAKAGRTIQGREAVLRCCRSLDFTHGQQEAAEGP